METIAEKKPRIRLDKNYVVEENIDAVQWPQECVACGGKVDYRDTIYLKEKFKNFGEIKIDVTGIPYCQICIPKIRKGKRVNQIHFILTLVIGIPLGILFILMEKADQNINFILFGGAFLLSCFIGYGLAWLFVKLPVKTFLKKQVVEPVDAWLITEEKKDKKEGISVVISIPNKSYASKFAQLNGVLPKGG